VRRIAPSETRCAHPLLVLNMLRFSS